MDFTVLENCQEHLVALMTIGIICPLTVFIWRRNMEVLPLVVPSSERKLRTVAVNLLMHWCGLYDFLCRMDLFCCFCRSYFWMYSHFKKRFQFFCSVLTMLELWSAMMQAILCMLIHYKQMGHRFCIYYRKPYWQLLQLLVLICVNNFFTHSIKYKIFLTWLLDGILSLKYWSQWWFMVGCDSTNNKQILAPY